MSSADGGSFRRLQSKETLVYSGSSDDDNVSNDSNVGEDGTVFDLNGDAEKRRKEYIEACKGLKCTPVSQFFDCIDKSTILLRHHGIRSKGFHAMTTFLLSNKNLRELDLAENCIGSALPSREDPVNGQSFNGESSLCELIEKHENLKSLDFSQNQVGGNTFCNNISQALRANTSLRQLYLGSNKVNGRALREVVMGLTRDSNSCIEVMDLSSNGIAGSSGNVLKKMVESSRNLKELNLGWNCLRNQGGVALVSSLLDKGSSITTLDISFNSLQDEVLRVLSKVLETKNTLETLNISNNKFTSASGHHLASSLVLNSGLVTLVAGFNNFGESKTIEILQAAFTNRSLKKLYLENTVFGGTTDNVYEKRDEVAKKRDAPIYITVEYPEKDRQKRWREHFHDASALS